MKRAERKDKNNIKISKKKSMKTPFSMTYYVVFMTICAALRAYFHASAKKSKNFKKQKRNGAMLVLCNHTTIFDFVFFAPPLFGRRVNFVVAENMLHSKPLFAKLIIGYHAITKKQNFADFQCIKNIKRYLDAGISVVLCPEGKVTADGQTGIISQSMGRLIKWLGYPVSTILTSGAGLTRPKWAKDIRKGKIVSNCDMLFSENDIRTLTKEEIFEKMQAALWHNEHEFQAENRLRFKGKGIAEGLNKLLYRCPKCESECTLKTNGDSIKCSNCGNALKYLDTGELVPLDDKSISMGRIDFWSNMQRTVVAEEVSNDSFRISKPVHLFIENDLHGYRFVATGEMSLNQTELIFASSQELRPKNVEIIYKISGSEFDIAENSQDLEAVEDEFKKIKFCVKNFVTVANVPGESLDLYDEKHSYRFIFLDGMSSTKFTLAIEEISKQR